MKSVRLRTLVLSSLLGAPIAVAFACGGHASRHFDDPPIDSGEGGAGSGGRDGSGGSMGGAGTGGGTNNPGCTPPSGELAALQLVSASTKRKGVTSGENVAFEFGPLAKDCAILECRRTQGEDDPGNWVPCATEDGNASHIRFFSDAESENDEFNGVWKLDVREAYEGAAGPVFSYQVYTHDSLDGVEACPDAPRTDQEILTEAGLLFEGAVAGSTATPFTNYSLDNPFIQVDFAPPVWDWAPTSSEGVPVGSGPVEFKSLRRRFVMNEAKTLLLMKRTFPSLRNDPEATGMPFSDEDLCKTVRMRVHRVTQMSIACDALVMNAQGFGMCLAISSEGVVTRVYASQLPQNEAAPSGYTGFAWDSFMWKKLSQYTRARSRQGMGYFSPKCDDEATCEDHELFLPHRALF